MYQKTEPFQGITGNTPEGSPFVSAGSDGDGIKSIPEAKRIALAAGLKRFVIYPNPSCEFKQTTHGAYICDEDARAATGACRPAWECSRTR